MKTEFLPEIISIDNKKLSKKMKKKTNEEFGQFINEFVEDVYLGRLSKEEKKFVKKSEHRFYEDKNV